MGDSIVFLLLTPINGTKITYVGGHSHNVTRMDNVSIWLPMGAIKRISHILYS
jgi:hypothetical protein